MGGNPWIRDIRVIAGGETRVAAAPTVIAQLAALLVATVAAGGSVGFMHPLPLVEAEDFWSGALASAARGERTVLGAWEGPLLLGTVTLLHKLPPNQPHRAEIAKMMTLPPARGRGVATALLQAAEALAVQRGKSLLVLDTAADGGASALYERLGYARCGEIPDYALKPHGGLTSTLLYWKRLDPPLIQSASSASRTSRPSPSSTL